MIEMLTTYFTSQIAVYVSGSIAAFVIAWILRKIPNDKFNKYVEGCFFRLGVLITLGLSKWKYTAKFWNKIIEPWIIDLIDNIVGAAVLGLIRGLRSDNKE